MNPDEKGAPCITNEATVSGEEASHGSEFARVRKRLGAAAGGKAIGCSLLEIPPGRRAWPFHWHGANEEALFILSGTGTLRLGEAKHAVAAGDYVALLPGKEHAHQLINSGDETLRYLCISTMQSTEVCGYPDSGKVGVFAGGAPGGGDRTLTAYFPEGSAVDYWDGEGDG